MQNYISSTIFSSLLFIDIETIPEEKELGDLSPEKISLWQHKRETTYKDIEDDHEAWKMSCLHPEFAKICCISIGLWNNNKKTFFIKNIIGKEFEILNIFQEFLSQLDNKKIYTKFCGYNIKNFDIPFLTKRALITGNCLIHHKLINWDKKPWEVDHVDLAEIWSGGNNRFLVKMEVVANVLGLKTSKDEFSGKDVYEQYYEKSNIKGIAEYCGKDVILSAQIYTKLAGLPIDFMIKTF